MNKLLFISELGNNVSYSYVTISLREILMKRFDCYFFCVRNLGKDDCIQKLVDQGFLESKLFYIEEDLLKYSINNEYLENTSDGIYQLEELVNNINPELIISLGDTELLRHHGLMLQNIKYTGIFIPYITIDLYNPEVKWFNYNKNYILTVSEHSKNELLKKNILDKKKIEAFPHITDQSLFRPLDSNTKIQLRKQILGERFVDSFIVGSINCNSFRKKWDILIESFCIFAQKCSNSVLLIKSELSNVESRNPIYGGYDFNKLLKQIFSKYNIELERVIIINETIPKKDMVNIYNLIDLFLTTTSGEGWGMTNIESALCKIPIIMPRTTSIEEIFGNLYEGYFDTYKYTALLARNTNYIDTKLNVVHNIFNCISISYNNFEELEIQYINNLLSINKTIPTIVISNYDTLEIEELSIIYQFKSYNETIEFIKNNDMPYVYQILVSIDFNILRECVDTINNNQYFKDKHLNKIIHIGTELIELSYDIDKYSYVEIGNEMEIANKLIEFYESSEKREICADYLYNKVINKYNHNKIEATFDSIMNKWIKHI